MTESPKQIILNKLDTRYIAALKTHAELYPQYKVFNDSPTIAKQYETNENNIANIQAKFFNFKNNLETNIISISTSATRIDEEITNLQKQNKVLKRKQSSLAGHKEGARGMYVDSKFLYRQFYLGNWLVVLTLVGFGIIYQKNK